MKGSVGNNALSSNGPASSLDLRVVGVCAGPTLGNIDCALVHYHQDTPDALLNMRLLNVSLL